jgi:mannose-6-phosphate isomerase-like protein (cupin superfamily)
VKQQSYIKKVVIKPWGEEHVCFHNKKKLGITFVKIRPKYQTSLHCHPNKKTGFIILSGLANVQIGLYKKNISTYKPLSILVLRPGLFHIISTSGKEFLYALETETPFKKDDLVRFDDKYGRKKKSYENFTSTVPCTKEHLIFNNAKNKINEIHKFKDIVFQIKNFTNNYSLKKMKVNKKAIAVILDGCLADHNSNMVIKYGEIVKLETILLLAKVYKIKNNLRLLIIEKN